MSWNGTVRCSYCYQTGHNKRSCPEIKQRAKDGNAWAQAHLERSKVKNRKCSYCHEPGHTKRTCVKRKNIRVKFVETTRKYRRLVEEVFKLRGVGKGALVRRSDQYSSALVLITHVLFKYISPFDPHTSVIQAKSVRNSNHTSHVCLAEISGEHEKSGWRMKSEVVSLGRDFDYPEGYYVNDDRVTELFKEKDFNEWRASDRLQMANRRVQEIQEHIEELKKI